MEKYTFDIEAVVFQSHLNDAPRRDPLEAAELAADMVAKPGFDREAWHCAKCNAYTDGKRYPDAFIRPSGVYELEGCDGCILSHLEKKETIFDVRDRLFQAWLEARERLDAASEQAKMAQAPAEQKAAQKLRRQHQHNVATAKRACELAGFDPAKRRRRRVRLMGEVPRAELAHPVVTGTIDQDGEGYELT